MLEPLTMPTLARRRTRGLTLLEVAIAIAVLAVLAALALPDISRRLERGRVQNAAESLAADIANTRFEAVRGNHDLFVETRPDVGAGWCWAVARQRGCDCGVPDSCQLHTVNARDFRGVRLIGGLALRMESGGAAVATAQAAVLETSRGEQLRVEVSPLGRARVCATLGSWPNVPAC